MRKWYPSKSQRRAFAERMKDPLERELYEERKKERERKRRANSEFDYKKAGGLYVPTENQYRLAMAMLGNTEMVDDYEAAEQVIYGYVNNEKIHHDYIHRVNEFGRSHGWNGLCFSK